MKEETKIKGFKGFDKDLKCRDFQFEVGKEFEEKGEIEVCAKGFHFCTNPFDVLNYYPLGDNRYCEVESNGKTGTHDDDSKVVTNRLKVNAEIGLKGLIKAGVEWIFEQTKISKETIATSGDYANAATSGYRANAATSGYRANAATSGNSANAATSGDYANAATSGNSANAATSGDYANAATSGNSANAATSGDYANAATSGNSANAATSGNRANAATSGDRANAATSGKNTIAAAIGIESHAKASLGSWIVLSEWIWNNNEYQIKTVKSAKIDGKKLKADTFYMLKGGKFIEAE